MVPNHQYPPTRYILEIYPSDGSEIIATPDGNRNRCTSVFFIKDGDGTSSVDDVPN